MIKCDLKCLNRTWLDKNHTTAHSYYSFLLCPLQQMLMLYEAVSAHPSVVMLWAAEWQVPTVSCTPRSRSCNRVWVRVVHAIAHKGASDPFSVCSCLTSSHGRMCTLTWYNALLWWSHCPHHPYTARPIRCKDRHAADAASTMGGVRFCSSMVPQSFLQVQMPLIHHCCWKLSSQLTYLCICFGDLMRDKRLWVCFDWLLS